jgi:lipoprotein NlpI
MTNNEAALENFNEALKLIPQYAYALFKRGDTYLAREGTASGSGTFGGGAQLNN